ncbi:MAG TPA: hypothetical protein VIN08_08835 [Ohtaekwangia sp.]
MVGAFSFIGVLLILFVLVDYVFRNRFTVAPFTIFKDNKRVVIATGIY